MRRYKRSRKAGKSRAVAMRGGFLGALLQKIPMIHQTLQTAKPLSMAKNVLTSLGVKKPGGFLGKVADAIDKVGISMLGYARRRRGKRAMM
jgi:hypothetical protein